MQTTTILSLTLAFSASTQIMNAQEQAPQNTPEQKETLGLEIGAKLPELTVTIQNGFTVPMVPATGHRWMLVFFYPKALTGGWTKQACSVQDALDELTKQQVSVFGVSTDSVETQLKFSQKESLNYSLVSDTDKKVTTAFKVPMKGNMASRQAYLFKDGILIWRDVKGTTAGQGEAILKVVKAEKKKDAELLKKITPENNSQP